MAAAAFLEVDGVPGESRARGFEDQIEVDGWEWGVSSGRTAGAGSGARAARPDVRDLTVVHRTDASSVGLLGACLRGNHLREVVLRVVEAGDGDVRPFLVVTLEDVVVTTVAVVAGDEGRPAETVTFAPASVDVTYEERRADGTPGPQHTVSWSVRRQA